MAKELLRLHRPRGIEAGNEDQTAKRGTSHLLFCFGNLKSKAIRWWGMIRNLLNIEWEYTVQNVRNSLQINKRKGLRKGKNKFF